jgi:sugar phosphate permease
LDRSNIGNAKVTIALRT